MIMASSQIKTSSQSHFFCSKPKIYPIVYICFLRGEGRRWVREGHSEDILKNYDNLRPNNTEMIASFETGTN